MDDPPLGSSWSHWSAVVARIGLLRGGRVQHFWHNRWEGLSTLIWTKYQRPTMNLMTLDDKQNFIAYSESRSQAFESIFRSLARPVGAILVHNSRGILIMADVLSEAL